MQTKKVSLDLTQVDGNAFMLIGAFRHQAKREGWSKEEIEAVTNDCMSSDYDHLIQVLIKHCKTPSDED